MKKKPFILAAIFLLCLILAISSMPNPWTKLMNPLVGVNAKNMAAPQCYLTFLPTIMDNPFASACSSFNNYCEDYDSFESAYGPLKSGRDYTAYPDDYYDVYYFVLSESGTVTAKVTSYFATGQLQLYDKNHLIDYEINHIDGKMQVTSNLEVGTYYIRVVTLSDDPNPVPYTLNVMYPPPTPPDITATPLCRSDGMILLDDFEDGEIDVLWQKDYTSNLDPFELSTALFEDNGRLIFDWESQQDYAYISARRNFTWPVCAGEVVLGIIDGSMGSAGWGSIHFRVDEGTDTFGEEVGELYSDVQIDVDAHVGFGWNKSTVTPGAGQETVYPPESLPFVSLPGEIISNVIIKFENVNGENIFYFNDIEIGNTGPIEETNHIVVWTSIEQVADINAYVEEAWVRYCE